MQADSRIGPDWTIAANRRRNAYTVRKLIKRAHLNKERAIHAIAMAIAQSKRRPPKARAPQGPPVMSNMAFTPPDKPRPVKNGRIMTNTAIGQTTIITRTYALNRI